MQHNENSITDFSSSTASRLLDKDVISS